MRAACCQATLNGGRPDSRQSPRNVYRRGRRRRSRTDRTTDTPAAQRRKRRVGEVHGALSRLGWARPPPSRGAAARAWASAAALRGGPGVSATGGSPSEAPGAGGAGPRAPSSSDPVQRRAGGARGERSPWRAARCGKTAARGEAPARICGRPPRASLPSLPSR
ncbi:unnamed protein product, partial [Prorocentrum cordatum]